MLVFDQIKLVYLANPKTGTTSFEGMFARYADAAKSEACPKHARFNVFRARFPDLAKRYQIVTTVRDPIDTLYSWYRYRSRMLIRGGQNSTEGMTFSQFFDEWCKDKPAPFADVKASVDFVTNRRGRTFPRMQVFRYESSPSVIDYVGDLLGVKKAPLRRNRSVEDQPLDNIKSGLDLNHPKIVHAYERYHAIEYFNEPDLVTER